MIQDLDRTLEELLRRELPAELVSQITISFATPDEQFPPPSVTLPSVDLFLYDIRENRDLRTNEWIVERESDGSTTKRRPPVRVECSYLITAWPSDSTPNPARDEHRLLGEVMKVMLRHPTIPAEVLQGGLKGQEPPLPAISLLPGRLEMMGPFWQALGGKLKAALNYMVTFGLEVHRPVQAEVVTEKMLKFRVTKETAP
ncbi:MAG: DUF4255 domain-containing protein [Deltaproteobacteria bacterium]|nr:DUF4255 domain-containing protein [Deltaproteobacteria bacterium]